MRDDAEGTAEIRDVEAWRGAVSGALLRFDVECARPERFRGSISRISLGETSLVAMTSHPHRATRESEHIDGAQPADYLLSLQLAGQAQFRQDGRRASVRPGDMVFYDSSRPVEITSGEGYRSLCFRFRREGAAGGRRAGDLTATTLDSAHGVTPAVAGLLTGLHQSLDRNGAAGAATLRATGRYATELTRAMFADELDRRGLLEPADPHEAMRERVDRHIDEHLADPELSPRSIAAALFVSTRHVHALLAGDGRTVAATIRLRRLERCLTDLADPARAATPVSAIAARWGFCNATRFGQLVKAETGRTPVAYRRAMLDGR
ncbi:helix-turn-helix domain-containing protein [Pseudonocardia sp. KRD291]|uniref:AraC-like ligand-binding domain-containing protein n=1 Tax=Pseudonocardia sp. KRD291 TaxID=2792007 RepID=UPI001C4A631A|nr:helix-turn-helix domain-containing protein [Pseudonocardia sp. KRD291]MBW0104440.1 helix-turn-helix domain-containing protein [Pseudonocardia sp. KRD291]